MWSRRKASEGRERWHSAACWPPCNGFPGSNRRLLVPKHSRAPARDRTQPHVSAPHPHTGLISVIWSPLYVTQPHTAGWSLQRAAWLWATQTVHSRAQLWSLSSPACLQASSTICCILWADGTPPFGHLWVGILHRGGSLWHYPLSQGAAILPLTSRAFQKLFASGWFLSPPWILSASSAQPVSSG